MKSFKEFLAESIKKIPYISNPEIGWWEDNVSLSSHHGTHISNVDSIAKTGLDRVDPTTGMISLTLDPNTARGYASMSGGESNFRQAGSKAKIVPMNERAVLVFKVPLAWIKQHMDKGLGGNVGDAKKNMADRTRYDAKKVSDQQYYQLTEFRVKTHVPAKFLVGYMVSK